jgi:hypothetical protein
LLVAGVVGYGSPASKLQVAQQAILLDHQ